MMPRVPSIPASVAAFIALMGLGLIYWSLTELGLLRPTSTDGDHGN